MKDEESCRWVKSSRGQVIPGSNEGVRDPESHMVPCPLQLMIGDDSEPASLRARPPNFMSSDDVTIADVQGALHTETSFTRPDQDVEKSEIDLF